MKDNWKLRYTCQCVAYNMNLLTKTHDNNASKNLRLIVKICVTSISNVITTKSDLYTFICGQTISQCSESSALVYFLKEEKWVFILRLIVYFTAHKSSFPPPCRIAPAS